MRLITAASLFALGLSSFLTAGTPSCPTCVEVDWSVVSGGIDLAGKALGADVESAILTITTANETCDITLPSSVIGEIPWTASVDYSEECGTDLAGSEIWVDRGSGMELAGILAD